MEALRQQLVQARNQLDLQSAELSNSMAQLQIALDAAKATENADIRISELEEEQLAVVENRAGELGRQMEMYRDREAGLLAEIERLRSEHAQVRETLAQTIQSQGHPKRLPVPCAICCASSVRISDLYHFKT
jgi:hypothetical protein